MGQDSGDPGNKKPDLKSALTASQLTAQTTTRAKVAVPQAAPAPKPAPNRETTVQARAVQPPTQSHVPTSVKRDPAKAAPAPIVAPKPAVTSGVKKKAPPNAKKVGWDPRMIRRFLSGHITLGELEEISKEDQYKMAKSGHRLLKQGKVDPAEKIFRGLLSLDPRDAYFHMAVGSCAQRRGDAVSAEAAYSASLQINPYSPFALANRGEVRLMLGRLVDGAQDLVAALQQDPELKQPTSRRAQATLRMLQAQLLALGIQTAEPKLVTSPKTAVAPGTKPNPGAKSTTSPKTAAIAPGSGPTKAGAGPTKAGSPAPSASAPTRFGAPKPAPGALPPRPVQPGRPNAGPNTGAPPRRPPIKK